MWPRLMSRGRPDSRTRPEAVQKSFNVATTDESWKTRHRRDLAQGSTGFNVATTDESWKTLKTWEAMPLEEKASMWPRLMSRGRREASLVAVFVNGASMWPRLMSRGRRLA